MIERFLKQTKFTSEQDFKEHLEFIIPEDFNFAYDVMDELYTDQPAGLCGNEDVGQMSAWYIMSALGLYQVEPCGGVYQLGSL